MQNDEFRAACDKVIGKEKIRESIGTLGEKTVHAVLKNYFEPFPENHEIKIGTYYADIVGENGIIEIQTANFHQLRKKLMEFLAVTRVTVVYPIPRIKELCMIDAITGEIVRRRKSPKKGTVHHIFPELYKIKNLLLKPNLAICIVLLNISEYRLLKTDKRSEKIDRIPAELVDEIYLFSPADYRLFLPENLPIPFTCKEYAAACKLTNRVAQYGVNILVHMGAIEKTGKKGSAFLYKTL